MRDTDPPARSEQTGTDGDLCHLAGRRLRLSQAENLRPRLSFCCILLTVGGLFGNVTYVLNGMLGVPRSVPVEEYEGVCGSKAEGEHCG